ncbi:hypothetical protein LEP1GSC151_0087, partial [Leptospira interrogans serovar Grippotyphosa str. LT2186]
MAIQLGGFFFEKVDPIFFEGKIVMSEDTLFTKK